MDLTSIIAIAGKPGLFKVVAQGNQSIIVESLLDKKRMVAHASNKISALEDISIYTTEGDVPLKEVYTSIFKKENGGPCVSHKESESAQRAYLVEVLPHYDQDRVYPSDIKKLFNWYNLLQNAGLLSLEEEVEAEVTEGEKTEKKASPEKEKKAKSATSKAELTTPKKVAAKASPKTVTAAAKVPAKKPTAQRKSS